jgi:hypothetical protein
LLKFGGKLSNEMSARYLAFFRHCLEGGFGRFHWFTLVAALLLAKTQGRLSYEHAL